MNSAGTLSRALERISAVLRHYAASTDGLSLTAAATLATLQRLGPCRITDLATLEGVTQPAMTQLATRLGGLGLVRRTADPGDRRAVLVEITPEGVRRLAARRDARAARLATLLEELTAEQRDALVKAVPALEALAELVAPTPESATPATPATPTDPAAPGALTA